MKSFKEQKAYLEFYISLNVKSLTKAKRVMDQLQLRIDKQLIVEDAYQDGINEFIVQCCIEFINTDPNILIIETLELLDGIGDKWLVESPKLSHNEYWKFRGERDTSYSNFKVNGIASIQFELTNFERKREHIEDFIE